METKIWINLCRKGFVTLSTNFLIAIITANSLWILNCNEDIKIYVKMSADHIEHLK